jgi:hypothetical protein
MGTSRDRPRCVDRGGHHAHPGPARVQRPPGLSFSSMLKEYIRQLPGQPKLILRDPPPGPVTFTPYQSA